MAAEDIPLRDVDGWKLLKSMPWSRRKRRSLHRSNDWNMHLFSGPSRPTSTTSTTSRLSVTEASGVNIEVDILDSALMDVTRMDGVFKAHREDLIWSRMMKKRAKEEPLVIRMLVLATVAMEGRRQHRSDRLGFALEHPDKVVAQGNVWSSSLWKGFSEVYGMEVVQSGRGSTGTNMYLEALNSLTSTTTTSGVWASEYAQAIGEAVNAWTGFSVHESVLCSVAAGPPPISCKMTAKEWQLHVSRDHRRVTHKSAYVLSADVAGPFRVKGVNTETNQHRFMLVCTYQFPKLPGTPDAQHESVDDDTGAGAGLEELLFEEEGGDDKHEIIEESGADKHMIIEKDGGPKVMRQRKTDSSGRDIKEVKTWWPMAAETAAVRQRSLVFGLESNPPAGFGTKVFVKRKRYGAEARDLDPKWSSAVYLGPARDVPAGHVVLTNDNHLWNTCNVRQLPDVPMEPDPSALAARRRISGKRPPVAPIPLKALRISSLSKGKQEERHDLFVKSLPVSEIKSVAKVEYLPKGDLMKPLAQVSHERQWIALEDCFAILEDTPFKRPTKTRNTEAWEDPGPDIYATFGAYQHGNFTGVTNATRDYPELVQYLTAFIRRHSGESDPFPSVVVARNLETGLHRDRYNVNGMRNIVDDSVVPTENQVVKLNPRRLHKSLPWKGTKWTIIAYVNRGFARLPEAKVQGLRDCGFLVPRCEEITLSQLRLQEEHVEFDYCETSDEEEHFVQSVAAESSLVNLRKLLDEKEKIEFIGPGIPDQEREYQGDASLKHWKQLRPIDVTMQVIWTALNGSSCVGLLKVENNMVRENVMAWKKAILKEVQALINCGALVKLDAAEEDRLQREGKLVILPAKGVFTVKPPDLQAAAEAIQSKPQDQLEFPDGVQSKPQDQLEFPDGVQSKPQDQLEFPDGVQSAKSSHVSGSIPVDALYKRKARLVICGNFEKNISEELYAGGCQTVVVLKEGSEEPDFVAAYIVVYVDDILYFGEPSTISDVHAWLSAEWTSSPLTWASDVDGIRRRSIGWSLITYNGNAVAWRSGRQSLIALSTAESELIEAVAAVQLQAGISSLTSEINASEIHLLLLVDNSAAVGLCTDAPGTWRTRHLRVRAGLVFQKKKDGWDWHGDLDGEEECC
ncbi:unnamed protein product [Symbiodinium sp. CCMP2592]|nr:unnamed protein product [Symbiodinium sp. CCMP2592]